MYIWAPQFSVVRAPPVATLVSSFHFITSLLWAPPVATQFSVLSQTFVKVRAPPVATLLFQLNRRFMSLGTACGDSVLWCVTVHTCIQTSRNVFVSSSFHCSISLCTACVDSVFCCSGTASSDPRHFSGLCSLWKVRFLLRHFLGSAAFGKAVLSLTTYATCSSSRNYEG